MPAWVTRLSHSIAQIAGMTTLSAIQNIVVLMLENRSFDHMLGMLYTAQGNVSPAGQSYEGRRRHASCEAAPANQRRCEGLHR
jgi:phospholipase C